MAAGDNSSIGIKDAANATQPVDAFLQASGDYRQAVVIGDATTTATQAVDSSGRAAMSSVNAAVTGTFTAVDAVVGAPAGDASLMSGASTAGSVIALSVPGGFSAWTFLLKGIPASFTVYSEVSTNSTNGTDGDWIEVKGRRTGTVAGTEVVDYQYTSAGYYRGNQAGFVWIRARARGTFSGAPSVQITTSFGTGAVFLNSGIPAGSSTIGAIKKAPSATGTITSVTSAATSTQLLAANTARLGATFYNDSTSTLYLALSTSASTTAYTVQVLAGGYYELPNDGCGYVGAVFGIWSSANGSARVTELT